MIEQYAAEFNGLACRWLASERVRLAITIDRGPRIVFCGLDGGRNLLAETPKFTLPAPNGTLALLGGHRLWYAPEVPERTYWSDHEAVGVAELPAGARFTAAIDGAGIEKSIALRLEPGEPTIVVEHRLRNVGEISLELAPWALTMVPLGGVTLLPQPQGNVDAAGLLPNRFLTLWPYSDPTDSRLGWGNRIILVRGIPGAANKLGYRNAHGWVAHWLDGTLLVKSYAPNLAASHPDNGCNAECYLNDVFMEVESLGGLVNLAPGETVTHQETWRLYAGIASPDTEAVAVEIARRLGLWQD